MVPPSKGKNANYLSIKHIYLRVVRGDFLERMGVGESDLHRTAYNTEYQLLGRLDVKDEETGRIRRSEINPPSGEPRVNADDSFIPLIRQFSVLNLDVSFYYSLNLVGLGDKG